MNKLSRALWEELDQQMSIMPAEADPVGLPGEHMKLIALLNRFGFNPVSRREAIQLGKELLQAGWREA